MTSKKNALAGEARFLARVATDDVLDLIVARLEHDAVTTLRDDENSEVTDDYLFALEARQQAAGDARGVWLLANLPRAGHAWRRQFERITSPPAEASESSRGSR